MAEMPNTAHRLDFLLSTKHHVYKNFGRKREYPAVHFRPASHIDPPNICKVIVHMSVQYFNRIYDAGLNGAAFASLCMTVSQGKQCDLLSERYNITTLNQFSLQD